MPLAVEENAIAHELYHIVLTCQGYSHYVIVPDSDPNRAFYTKSGTETIDCVEDPLIDKQLKALGFDPRILNHESLIVTKLPAFSREKLANEGFQQLNGLYLYCSFFRMKARSDNLEERWAKVSPDVVKYAHLLQIRVPDVSCSDPRSCFEKEKLIRSVFDHKFKLENPVTKQPE